MKTEVLYIIRGIKKLGVWFLDKRHYILTFWVVGWITPTVLVALDAIKTADSIPKGKMLAMAQALGISLEQIVPTWSWELNKQWVELSTFRPGGLVMSFILIIILVFQYMREANATQQREYKDQRADY